MKRITFILVLLFPFVCLAQAEEDISQKFINKTNWTDSKDKIFSLRISTNKKEYKIIENILLKIELKNMSTKTVTIQNIIYTLPGVGRGISIAGPREIQYYGAMKEIHAYPTSVSPNQVIIKLIQIKTENWLGTDNNGRYIISYKFESAPNDIDKNLWEGTIESEELYIFKD